MSVLTRRRALPKCRQKTCQSKKMPWHVLISRDGNSQVARQLTTVPPGRIGTPRDMGLAAAFLVSDASAYVTRQALNVTGGQITEL